MSSFFFGSEVMMVCGRSEAEIPLHLKPFAWPLHSTQLIQWTFRWNQNDLVFSLLHFYNCLQSMMINSVSIMDEALERTLQFVELVSFNMRF